MAQGRTNAAVAEDLHLSESSIEKYASSVFVKPGLSDERHVHRRVAGGAGLFAGPAERSRWTGEDTLRSGCAIHRYDGIPIGLVG